MKHTRTFLLIAISFPSCRAFSSFLPPSISFENAQETRLYSSFDNVEQPKPITSVASSKQKKKDLKTFNRYLEIESWKRGPSARDLEPVLRAIGEACKQINRIVQRAQTDDLYGAAVDENGNALEDNIQGEVQQKLDVVCNAIMLKQFCGSSKGIIAAVASEEEDTTRCCSTVMVSSYSISKLADLVTVPFIFSMTSHYFFLLIAPSRVTTLSLQETMLQYLIRSTDPRTLNLLFRSEQCLAYIRQRPGPHPQMKRFYKKVARWSQLDIAFIRKFRLKII